MSRHIAQKISPRPSLSKRGNSVRRQSPNTRLEVSNAALDGGASLLSPTQPPAQEGLWPGGAVSDPEGKGRGGGI